MAAKAAQGCVCMQPGRGPGPGRGPPSVCGFMHLLLDCWLHPVGWVETVG